MRAGLVVAVLVGVSGIGVFGGPAAAAEPPRLALPVACELGRNCVIQNFVDHDDSAAVRDYACGRRSYDRHDGTDIRLRSLRAMREGVAVVAAAAGRVLRARDGVADTVGKPDAAALRGRECGNGVVVDHGDGWETQYCHMAAGSIAVRPGDRVAAGAPLGRIGMSGQTEFPHLHFTVRAAGKVVDPFAFGAEPGACNAGRSLWDPGLEGLRAYQAGLVLDAGFSSAPVAMAAVEAGDTDGIRPGPTSPALIAFVRAIGLRAGDVQRVTLLDPGGAVMADSTAAPLDADKAQYLLFVGKRRTAERWAPGTYRATYTVRRGGEVVIEHGFDLAM